MTATATAVKERHIDFTGEQVKAVLEGRMTQVRRVVKGLPDGIKCASAIPESGYQWRFTDFNGTTIDLRCPYGRPAVPLEPCDRLWVREAWYLNEGYKGDPDAIGYAADNAVMYHDGERLWSEGEADWLDIRNGSERVRSLAQMPRKYSRLTLGIKEIRVERVQDISTRDCEAEGIQYPVFPSDTPGKVIPLIEITGAYPPLLYLPKGEYGHDELMRANFASRWDTLNAKKGYSFESNPFVWCISFRRI